MIENNFNKDLERKIDLYINGRLNQQETDELWAELIQNEYYLDYLKSAANLKAIIEESRKIKPISTADKFKQYSKYVAAAAVIMVAGVIGLLNYNASTVSSVQPIPEIGLDIVRNAEGISETIDNETIKEAIRLASVGQVEDAIVILQDELKTTDDVQVKADIALSLGSIQYNHGEYQSSVDNFNLVVNQENINTLTLEKAYWYLGNAHFQLDNLIAAKEAFEKAYELDGAYSRVSRTYLEAIQNVE